MAHITEFKIDGLAGRPKSYNKKLHPDINVFFGLNGAGKTSLLRILNSAMNYDNSVENIPVKRAEVKIYSIDFDRVFTYVFEKPQAERVEHTTTESLVPNTADYTISWDQYNLLTSQSVFDPNLRLWRITPPLPEGAKGLWNHGWLPTSRLYFGSQAQWRRARELDFSEGALDSLFQDSLTSLWSQYSAKLLGQVRRVQEAGLSNILQAVLGPPTKVGLQKRLDAATARERVITFLNRQGAGGKLGSLEDFERRYGSDPRLALVAEHIDKVETDVEEATAPRARLEGLIQRMFSGQKQLSFTDTAIKVLADGNQDIGLRSLSSGEKHALRIFAEALRVEYNTLLIDEPEISLHIDWQRELIKSIHMLSPSRLLKK